MWWELQKPEALHQLLVQSTSMYTLTPPIVNSVPCPILHLPVASFLDVFPFQRRFAFNSLGKSAETRDCRNLS